MGFSMVLYKLPVRARGSKGGEDGKATVLSSHFEQTTFYTAIFLSDTRLAKNNFYLVHTVLWWYNTIQINRHDPEICVITTFDLWWAWNHLLHNEWNSERIESFLGIYPKKNF